MGGLRWRLAQLEDQNAALREEQQRLEAERERLCGENERLRAERDRLQAANEWLRAEVDALRRAAKRQAAPFSKDDPTPTPQRPGRKPGAAYGTRAHRHPPEHVDWVITVGLPACCPGCGGELAQERVAVQYHEDLPSARPLVTCYQLHVGRCQSCGRRVQPHHPGQTSDALGAGGTQIGPRAVALASWLSKALGVPARQDRSAVCPAGAAHHPWWGRPGGRPCRPGMPGDLPGADRRCAGQSRGRPR